MVIVLAETQTDHWDDEEIHERMLEMVGPGFAVDAEELTFSEAERREIRVRGEPAVLSARDASHGGDEMRQVRIDFEGRGGPAMLLITGEPDGWDQSAVDTIIETLH
jgi:hypothetical protein